LPLIKDGGIQTSSLITVRRGEFVRDTVKGGIAVIEEEIVKFREHKDGGCVFYEKEAERCTVYDRRPLECKALQCWNTAHFMEVYREPTAIRKDVVSKGVLLGLIEKHDERCSYAALHEHVQAIQERGEEAIDAIIDLMRFDYELRPFVAEKLGIPMEEMDFYFGRPLFQTVVMFGLKVDRLHDGTFCLNKL
jgi:Fe-S-cluster containining protein